MSSDKCYQTSPTLITNSPSPVNSITIPDTSITITHTFRTTRKKIGQGVLVDMINNKPKRKNAVRACVQCRKSHITCGDERPCKSCIQRGLSEQCKDRQSKVKYLLEPKEPMEPSSSASVTTISDPIEYIEEIPVQNIVNQPTLAPTLAPILNNVNSVTNNLYMVEPCQMDYGFFSETANLEYRILNSMLSDPSMLDLGAYQGFPDFPLTETCSPLNGLPSNTTISSDTLPQNNSEGVSGTSDTWPQNNSDDDSGTSFKFHLSPLLGKKDLTWQREPDQIASSYSKVTSAFRYTKAYHFLLSYIKENLSKENVLRICRAISQFRPSFISLFMSLSEEDLIYVEKSFQRSLLELEKLLDLSGTPTVVWRRSGDIVLVGKEFSILTNWSPEELLGKTTYIYELMDEESCVSYWEKYSTHAFDISKSSVRATCIIYDAQKRLVPCAFCFAIKRDIFDIPSMIVGSFLPQLQ